MSMAPDVDQLREAWLHRLAELVETIKGWADELGWSTRQIDITLNDSQIGRYTAPALLIQEDAVRIFLEPIARSAPGAEGVVDLYLMPGYDDIASLYYYRGQWRVHYMLPGTSEGETIVDADAAPITIETLQGVLEEMKKHAGQV